MLQQTFILIYFTATFILLPAARCICFILFYMCQWHKLQREASEESTRWHESITVSSAWTSWTQKSGCVARKTTSHHMMTLPPWKQVQTCKQWQFWMAAIITAAKWLYLATALLLDAVKCQCQAFDFTDKSQFRSRREQSNNKDLEALSEIQRKNVDCYCTGDVTTQKVNPARRRQNAVFSIASYRQNIIKTK